MKVTRTQATVIRNAIEQWHGTGTLDEATAARLKQDLQIIEFDWKKLAKYSFWVALICIVTAVGAVLSDRVLVELLQTLFNAPHAVKLLVSTLGATLLYWVGIKRQRLHPQKIFSNEAILFLGVLATGTAVYQLGRTFDTGSGHFSILFLLSTFIYAALGFLFRSNLIWIFALVSFGSWMGTETGYVSGWGAYYLGMNFPLRFVLFGGVMTAAALAFEKYPRFSHLFRSTLAMGLLYLFIALWIMSIFGNYGDIDSWKRVGQIELFHWSLIFGIVSGAAIYHGLKSDNGMTKGFGLTFLFINLYTRFFEYFWEATHKAVFFAVLAVSFWILGTRAEKIWQLGERK